MILNIPSVKVSFLFIYEDNVRFDGDVLHVECFPREKTFSLWSSSFFGFESFLLSIVVAIAEAAVVSTVSITVSVSVTKSVVDVVGISRRFGGVGGFNRSLAVDNSMRGVGVAGVAVYTAESVDTAKSVDTVVRVSRRFGSRSRISRSLAIEVAITAIGVRVASIVTVVTEAIVAVVGISVGSGLGGGHGQGGHGENDLHVKILERCTMRGFTILQGTRWFEPHQSLDHAAAAVVGLKCDEFLGGCCLNTIQQQQRVV